MRAWLCLLLSVFLLPHMVWATPQKREVLGWVEKVKLMPSGFIIHAKLDTGADSSSLNASDLIEFDKSGKKWVRFTVTSRSGETVSVEKEVVRVALIKRHSGVQKRNVVRLGICVGSTYMESDVNLVDRTNFDYQMLIGRIFLAGNAVIDPASTYTSEPNCKGTH